jgi:hypothetical protein
MVTLGIEDAPDGFESRTFGCRKCHRAETRLLAADPMKMRGLALFGACEDRDDGGLREIGELDLR